jgi:hypothetical protein
MITKCLLTIPRDILPLPSAPSFFARGLIIPSHILPCKSMKFSYIKNNVKFVFSSTHHHVSKNTLCPSPMQSPPRAASSSSTLYFTHSSHRSASALVPKAFAPVFCNCFCARGERQGCWGQFQENGGYRKGSGE